MINNDLPKFIADEFSFIRIEMNSEYIAIAKARIDYTLSTK